MASNYEYLKPEKSDDEQPHLTTLSSRFSASFRKPKTKQKHLPLDQFFETCSRQPPLVKFLAITILSGLPLIVFLMIAYRAFSIHKTVKEVAEWLAISWAIFISWFWLGKGFAAATDKICSLSKRLVKYRGLAGAVSLRLNAFLWSVISYAIITPVFHDSLADPHTHEPARRLRMAFLIITVAFAIFLVQGIFLELVSIRYIAGWAGPRSQLATDELETMKNLHKLMDPQAIEAESNLMSEMFRRIISPHHNDLYDQIATGNGDEDMWTEYAGALWDNISRGSSSLTRFDIDQQLRNMGRNAEDGQDLFKELDESCDGNVTREEVEKLIHRLGKQLNLRAHAQKGIKSVLRRLEVVMTDVAAFVVVFLYIEVFAEGNARNLASIFMGFSGLGVSFAFGGVVLDFVGQVIFVFAKHPYDVGDFIEAKDKKLVVCKIFLTHTNFEEVSKPTDRGMVVQMGHTSLISEPIRNWTRTMETVAAENKEKEDKEEEKEKEKKELETKEKDAARDLILLKTALLKRQQEENM